MDLVVGFHERQKTQRFIFYKKFKNSKNS